MSKVSKASDIWALTPTTADLREGARYAQISLPWTFNRMVHNTSTGGQRERALNIAKGIVGQEILRRKLADCGVKAEVQRKSHREDDLFDVHVNIAGTKRKLDLKTTLVYSDYPNTGRQPLSPTLIEANIDYPGPDWRRFFPMLVPADQTGQGKETYCFAIACCTDFRRSTAPNPAGEVFATFPYGEHLPFLSLKGLCKAREVRRTRIHNTTDLAGNRHVRSQMYPPHGHWRVCRQTRPAGLLAKVRHPPQHRPTVVRRIVRRQPRRLSPVDRRNHSHRSLLK